MSSLALARDEPWTEADLDDLPEGYRYEIVDGRLLVSPRPANPHARLVSHIVRQLNLVIPEGFEVWIEPRLTLPNSSRSPDIAVVRLAEIDPDGMSIGPEAIHLAVEVESPSSVGDDRVAKPREYARAGIPAYWQVDQGGLISAWQLPPGARRYRRESGPTRRVELPYPVDLAPA